MKKNIKIYLPIVLVVAYIAIIWPWGKPVKDLTSTTSSTNNPSLESEKNSQAGIPLRKGDPNFKPQVVDQPKSTKKDEKFFRTTSPEALAHAENERIALEKGPGKTPAVTTEQIQESKQLQSAIEATKDPKKFGSRLSPLVKAAPFDKLRFLADKAYQEEYLSTAEPARVYQVDDNSEYQLKRKSPYFQEVEQGDSVFITVDAEPNMPVSITSFDLGKFANHLTYQTVLADSSGSATFEFFGMPGTFNNTNILVSSPTTKGQLKFVVYTKIKTEKAN